MMLPHGAAENLRRQQRAEEIQIEDETDAGRVEIEEGLEPLDLILQILGKQILFARGPLRIVAARAVDQNVAVAERRLDCRFGFFQALDVEHVRSDADRPAARRDDLVGDLRGRLFLQIENCDLCAARQGLGHGGTEDAAAAGDDGHFSG